MVRPEGTRARVVPRLGERVLRLGPKGRNAAVDGRGKGIPRRGDARAGASLPHQVGQDRVVLLPQSGGCGPGLASTSPQDRREAPLPVEWVPSRAGQDAHRPWMRLSGAACPGEPVEEAPTGVVPTAPPSARARVIDPRGRGPRLDEARATQGLLLRGPLVNHQLPVSQPALVAPPWGPRSGGAGVPARRGCQWGLPRHHAPGTPPEGMPGGVGPQGEVGRMPGAVRAVVRSRTWHGAPASSVRPVPGLGSTSPHVVSDPRPEWGEGRAGVTVGRAGRCGMGGRASGPRVTRVRRTSSVVGQNRQVSRWDSTVAPPSAVGRERRHRVHCSTGQPLSHSYHSWSRLSGPRVAGSIRSRRPVASSWMNWRWGAPRRAHGPEHGGGRGGPGLGSTSPHRSREGGDQAAVFWGGSPTSPGNPWVAGLLRGYLNSSTKTTPRRAQVVA